MNRPKPMAPIRLIVWASALLVGGFTFWALFFVWLLPVVRRLREAHPVVNLYFSAILAMCVFPFVVLMPGALCLDIADESRAFIRFAGPPWLVKALLWAAVLASACILWRVVPVTVRTFRAQAAALRELSRNHLPESAGFI